MCIPHFLKTQPLHKSVHLVPLTSTLLGLRGVPGGDRPCVSGNRASGKCSGWLQTDTGTVHTAHKMQAKALHPEKHGAQPEPEADPSSSVLQHILSGDGDPDPKPPAQPSQPPSGHLPPPLTCTCHTLVVTGTATIHRTSQYMEMCRPLNPKLPHRLEMCTAWCPLRLRQWRPFGYSAGAPGQAPGGASQNTLHAGEGVFRDEEAQERQTE